MLRAARTFLDLPLDVVLLCAMCMPLLWIGYAWGLQTVRQPAAGWQRRVRWSWVAAFGVAIGVFVAPLAGFLPDILAGTPWGDAMAVDLQRWLFQAGVFGLVCGGGSACALAMITAHIARRSGRWCLACGYDISRAATAVCPECGAPSTKHEPEGSPEALLQARRKANGVVVRASLGALALAAVVLAGFALYDCVVAVPRPYGPLVCAACGAVNMGRVSPTLGIVLAPIRVANCDGSATCAHQWREQRDGLNTLCTLMSSGEGGAVVFSVDRGQGTIFGSLEPPGAGEERFTLRWRAGPGSLAAPDATTVRLRLPSVNRTAWRRGEFAEPPPTPLPASALAVEQGGDERYRLSLELLNYEETQAQVGFRVPRFYVVEASDRPGEWVLCCGGGTSRYWDDPGMAVAVPHDPRVDAHLDCASVAAADWPRVKQMDAPWTGIELRCMMWERFGTFVPTNAPLPPTPESSPDP